MTVRDYIAGQALHKFQRRHPDVRGAVAPRAFELQHDIPRSIALHPFVSDRGARDVAAQPFEFLALMGATAHRGILTHLGLPARAAARAGSADGSLPGGLILKAKAVLQRG